MYLNLFTDSDQSLIYNIYLKSMGKKGKNKNKSSQPEQQQPSEPEDAKEEESKPEIVQSSKVDGIEEEIKQ